MTNFKEKHGEYIYYDDDARLVKIEWYTHGHFDCELDVTDGEHSYGHGNGTLWQKYILKDPNLKQLESELINKIGLNVSINNKKNNSGSIYFEYKNLDQLNRIIEIIKINY